MAFVAAVSRGKFLLPCTPLDSSTSIPQSFLTILSKQKHNQCCRSRSNYDSLITSSFFRAFVAFVTNTFMMSIVQSLASILVCDNNTNMLLIDPSVTCWVGFHRSVAVLSMCDNMMFLSFTTHCLQGSFLPSLCPPVGFSGIIILPLTFGLH